MVSEFKVESLAKKFGSKEVVKDVSFSVSAGEVVGLLGPNGAGKTTSFYMALGLVQPDKGQVFLDGAKVGHLSLAQRAKKGLGYLPQEPSIFRRMTVEQNILVALEAKRFSGKIKKQKLEELVDEFGLGKVFKSKGVSLSGGERRRVEIARAIAIEPSFLLLDEPFAGIDPIAVNDIQNLIVKLVDKGLGLLITDHNVRETLHICNRSYVLKSGEVVVEGTSEEIINSKVARDSYLGENFNIN